MLFLDTLPFVTSEICTPRVFRGSRGTFALYYLNHCLLTRLLDNTLMPAAVIEVSATVTTYSSGVIFIKYKMVRICILANYIRSIQINSSRSLFTQLLELVQDLADVRVDSGEHAVLA